MKKLISLFLCIIFVFTLTACKDKDVENTSSNVDIEYYVNLGSMPEVEYSLGTDPEIIKEELSKKSESSEEDFVYDVIEGEKNVLIDNGTFCYYYKKKDAKSGINYIVNYDTAFEVEIGSVILDVKNTFSNVEFTEEPLNEENAFFVFGAQEGTVLKAEFDENTVLFVFVENALSATAIYKNN